MSYDDKTIVNLRNDKTAGIGAGIQKPVPGNRAPAGFQRPMPGGRGNGLGEKVSGQSVSATRVPPAMDVPPIPNHTITANSATHGVQSTVYINPVVHCASDLIESMSQFRSDSLSLSDESGRDIQEVREGIVRQIRDFEWRCGQCGVDEESILYSRYVLCTVIDEFATKTPWGGGGWSSQSLLSQFHDETKGGEKFFQILEYLQSQPATYLPVLELMYIALSLGFEGKFSLQNRGNVEIDNLRDNVFHLIRLQRGEPERDLSPQWKGVSEKRYTLMKHVPVWVVASLAGVVLLALYSGFSYQLSETRDELVASLRAPIVSYLPVESDVAVVQDEVSVQEPSTDNGKGLEK